MSQLWQQWTPISKGGGCEEWRGTRSALVALRNAGNLTAGCSYVITDYNQGTVGSAEIMLQAMDGNTLTLEAAVKTSFDNVAWNGLYDIDANRLTYLADNLGNRVNAPNSVDSFVWGVAQVTNNVVDDATLNYTSGNVNENEIRSSAVLTVNSGNVQRNTIGQSSNVTITSADFRENVVEGDATVNISTTGDVDNSRFESNSNTTVSGSANMDNSTVGNDGNVTLSGSAAINHVQVLQSANLTISGGNLTESTVEQDAQVTIVSGSNTENLFGESSIYVQVGTGTINYTEITGTSQWTNGNTNISNVKSNASPLNTTGSAGSIYNSTFSNANLGGMQNVDSLTLAYCNFDGNSQVSANGATRLYAAYVEMNNYGRIIVSADRQLDVIYTGIRDYSYVQVTNGRFYVSYSSLGNVSYAQHTSTGTNRMERTVISTQSRVRFLSTVDNCRIYYSEVSSGSMIEHQGNSSGSYIYYCNAEGASQIYTSSSVNARMYYCSANGRGIINSRNNSATHYMYYCVASGSGYVQAVNNTGTVRLYAVHASSQAILQLQNSNGNGNLYYSSFAAYYYLYVTLTGNITRYGMHGYGRRSYTVTNPPNGSYSQNF